MYPTPPPLVRGGWGHTRFQYRGWVSRSRPCSSCSAAPRFQHGHIPVGSVADPDLSDPYVFGPPGSRSGSISQRYGSGSFYHQAKIAKQNLDSYCFVTTVWLFIFSFLLRLEGEWRKYQDPKPDPLVWGMDPRIRFHTKMSWIRNTAGRYFMRDAIHTSHFDKILDFRQEAFSVADFSQIVDFLIPTTIGPGPGILSHCWKREGCLYFAFVCIFFIWHYLSKNILTQKELKLLNTKNCLFIWCFLLS